LSELFGKLLVTYDNGVMKLSMPSAKVTVKGQLQDFEGFEQIQTYKVVIKNKDTIVLETTDEEGKKDIALLKFEGEDKYWIYLPSSVREISIFAPTVAKNTASRTSGVIRQCMFGVFNVKYRISSIF